VSEILDIGRDAEMEEITMNITAVDEARLKDVVKTAVQMNVR